jgi:chromate reductase
MQVLAISGSLRRRSHNTALLHAATELAPDGIELALYTDLGSLPPYNEDDDVDPAPAPVADLRGAISSADAVLIATPEYNGTVPGQLKQVVDWGSRPYGSGSALYGKPVAVIGASVTDYGALWAQDHLRKALGIAGARVVATELPLGRADGKFDEDGRLIDEEAAEQLRQVLRDLAAQHADLAQAA